MSRGRQLLAQARITKGAMWILFITTGASLVFQLAGTEIQAQLAPWILATGDLVWGDFHVWALATSAVFEVEFFQLIITGFMLWMFLPALERWWGTRRFVLFALYTSLAGTVAGTLVGYALGGGYQILPVSGLDTFVFAGIAAYGSAFPNQSVRFFGVIPMNGKQFTIGICLFVGLFIVLGQDWVTGAAYVAGIVLALAMTNSKFSFKLWRLKRQQKKLRSHLKLVPDDDKNKRWMN